MFISPLRRTWSATTTSNRIGSRTATTSLALGLLALSACGGSSAEADESGSDVASLDEVASLDPAAAGESAGDEGSTLDADEAALEFSQCLRDQGLDVPDIGVDANGNIDLRGTFQDLGPDDGGFGDALDACRDIIADVGFGGGRGAGGFADNTAVQDAMVEMTECVREQGFPEAAELSFGQQGQGGAPPDNADGEQRGQGQATGPGQGGLGSRFAAQMGLDPEDPDVTAAMETCLPIIEDAFAAAGVGTRGQADG